MIDWPECQVRFLLSAFETKQYVFMQSTGRFDINEKEIFDGDIVHARASVEYSDDSTVADVIFGEDLQWQIRSDNYQHGLPLTWGGWDSLEVIGNIYTNPDLTEAKRKLAAHND
jgi:uncharacterized phage protein (TIGR01671 family)